MESMSGIQYKGFSWGNYWGNTDRYLKKLDINKIHFKEEVKNKQLIITKLVINGKKVE